MAYFIKPEVLKSVGNSAINIKLLCVDEPNNHLQRKINFIGDLAKQCISLASKLS